MMISVTLLYNSTFSFVWHSLLCILGCNDWLLKNMWTEFIFLETSRNLLESFSIIFSSYCFHFMSWFLCNHILGFQEGRNRHAYAKSTTLNQKHWSMLNKNGKKSLACLINTYQNHYWIKNLIFFSISFLCIYMHLCIYFLCLYLLTSILSFDISTVK